MLFWKIVAYIYHLIKLNRKKHFIDFHLHQLSILLIALSKKVKKVEYGPFTNTEPFEVQDVRIHYENNTPFMTFKEVTKSIEVSHWGNIAIQETYLIRNEGA